MTTVNSLGLLAAADNPVTSCRPRELSKTQHFILDIDSVLTPRLTELRVVERSQNGHSKNAKEVDLPIAGLLRDLKAQPWTRFTADMKP